MLIGICATNDFAFKITFGTPENRIALIGLLNAILNLASPIVDVTLVNPFNLQEYKNDKLSILDIKAIDASGVIYNIEMQMTGFAGLVQRLVFYGCELYADQLKAGDDYTKARKVFSICLIDGIIWPDGTKVHHRFRFTDAESGRVLENTIEIHTLEFGRYNLTEADLKTATDLECWIYWFLHAHEYDPEKLRRLLPQAAIQKATDALVKIRDITEDKAMYDAHERARRDQQAILNDAHSRGVAEGERKGKLEGTIEGERKGKLEGRLEGKLEGKIEGKIEAIRTLQMLLGIPAGDDGELRRLDLSQLEAMASELQKKLRNRIVL